MSFLIKASQILARSLDVDGALTHIAELAAAHVADWCIVHRLDEAHGPRVVASAHRRPEKRDWAALLLQRLAQAGCLPPLVRRTIDLRQPHLIPVVTEELLRQTATTEEAFSLLQEAAIASLMVVPLIARDRILGTISLMTTRDSQRYYGSFDLALAEDLAWRTALFIDNTRLYAERSLAEEALRDRTQEAQALINASPLPIVHTDVDGRVIEWNPAAERITGWRRSEVIGSVNPMLPLPRAGRDEQLFERLRRGETLEGIVVRRRRRDGSMMDLTKWASPLKDAAGNVRGVLAIYMDVTDRTRFLQVAAHELGNPLSTIKALLTLVRLYVESDKPKERILSHLERLNRETDRFATLLEEIIAAFRAHQGTLPLRTKLLDARDLVQAATAGFSSGERPLVLCLGDEPALVWGDPRYLSRVVVNLVDNAYKYSPAGTEVRVWVETKEDHVLIAVRDHGNGIPRAQLPQIFNEFYRVDEGHSAEGAAGVPSGMGLGLFICREIVLQHQGHIWAESEEGEGATFYVRLPKADPRTETPESDRR